MSSTEHYICAKSSDPVANILISDDLMAYIVIIGLYLLRIQYITVHLHFFAVFHILFLQSVRSVLPYTICANINKPTNN